MAPKWRFLSLALIFILPLGVTFVSKDVATSPNSLEVICQVGDITTEVNDYQPNNHIVLPVWLTNVTDSIAGFTLWVRSTWPELLRFAVDTVIGDAIYAEFDTVGTRSRGFKFFEARIQDGMHAQVKVSALCDADSPRVVKPIPPGSGILVNLIMETTPADSVCDSLPIMQFALQFNDAQTSFSNPASQTIGCNYVLKVDTTWGCCKTWDPSYTICLEYWPEDHMCINERWWCESIDTNRVKLWDGSNEFVCGEGCICGDANGDGNLNISDAVYLIAYIFAGGTAPGACAGYANGRGDANGDGTINVSDAVYLISFIFSHGPDPHCP